jgi:hypothetical protein
MTTTMTSEQRKAIRGVIKRYLAKARANQPQIHYSQWRPTQLHAPFGEWATDCSGLCINAFHWADMWLPYKVKDPGGFGYTGIGNTQTILNTNRRRRVPLDRKFFVGDMALFGSWSRTKHVIICDTNGDQYSSIWTSHGSERGPYRVRLHYRSDLLCVVRAESLA